MLKDKILSNSKIIQCLADLFFPRSKYLVIAITGLNIGHLVQEFIIASSICGRDKKTMVIIPPFNQCNSEVIKCNIDDLKIIRNGIRVTILKSFLYFLSILFKLRNILFAIARKILRNNYKILLHRPDTVCIGFEGINTFRKVIGSNFYWDHDLMRDKPKISLNHRQESSTDKKLKTIGLDKKDWYICLHIREGNYAGASPFRDVSIKNYIPLINYISSIGGKVIKMGDKSMEKTPIIDGLIDYATSSVKDELTDLILINKCKLFLGTNSGLGMVGYLLDKDVINVNFHEFVGAFFGNSKATLFKNFYLKSKKEKLEINSFISSEHYKNYFYGLKNDLILHENTSGQILDLVKRYFNNEKLIDNNYNDNLTKIRKSVHQEFLDKEKNSDMMSDYLKGTINCKTNVGN